MNLWNHTKGTIAVVAVLAAIALYKVNKQNVQNFHDFVTDNNLEETFDEWGQFGIDIRVRADDPSPIIPMSKKNKEDVSKAKLDEESTIEREPLFKDTTTKEKVGIVLMIIPTYLMAGYIIIRSIFDPKKREEWAAISNPDKSSD